MATTTAFTGNSQFSTDFQSVVARTVAIASLPLTQKQNDVKVLQLQSVEVNSLTTSFSALQSAIDALGSSLGSGSFGASVTDGDVVTANLTGTPLPGTFSVEVIDLGAYATSMSADSLTKVADPSASNLSDAHNFTLTVGGKSVTVSPSGTTLSALAEAINLHSDANVQATIVNIGSPSSPDYRLSLKGINLGDQPIQLTAIDGSTPGQNLLNTQTTGAYAQYRVNGQPSTPISSDTRVVTISPGVSVTMYGEGTTDVTVSRNTTGVSSALSRFASAYNGAQAAIDRNRGEGTGALHGQSVLQTLTGALHRISQYSGGKSGMESLTSLGLTFDKNGILSFDNAKFSTATTGKIPLLESFLGSPTSGGFLKSVSQTMETIAGKDAGVLTSMSSSLTSQITSANEAISKEEDRIDVLRSQVEARMAAADAAVAALEQKANYISSMFTALTQSSRGNQ